MAVDYKSYSSKKSKRGGHSKLLPIAVVVIVVVLLLIAGLHKISERKLAKQTALKTAMAAETNANQKEKKTTKTQTDGASATTDTNAQPEIKFEFYNILPNEKVADNTATASDNTISSTKPTSPTTKAAATTAEESKVTPPVTSNPTPPLPSNKSTTQTKPNGYIVQVVSVRNLHDADAISSKLKSDGFNVQTIKIKSGDTDWYRIQVGPYPTMDEALSAQMTLRKNNYHAILLKPKG